jgi:hypothetical protein
MRDAERIPRILDKLRQVWETKPDMRFFQLMDNYVTGHNNWQSPSIYYIEDDRLEEHLDKIISGEIKI